MEENKYEQYLQKIQALLQKEDKYKKTIINER